MSLPILLLTFYYVHLVLSYVELVNSTYEGIAANAYQFKHTVNKKLTDYYKHQWRVSLQVNSRCTTYHALKASLSFEKYLGLLNERDRVSLSTFRCGNHRLPIVTGGI